ncbi:MAG: AAA family ATPase [Thermomicrobiales bacterium]|nr:AAA family ATPase [Thermomicrobiales bacterium]
MTNHIGRRIIVIGSSGCGKTTLGSAVAERLGIPFVELDALHWDPNWTPAPDAVFQRRVRAAIEQDAWVLAGNYTSKQQHISWPHADTIIWLDLSLTTALRRSGLRSWRRWRTQEEIWNGNREIMRDHLAFWDPDRSLLTYTVLTHRRRRRQFEAALCDPRWSEITFVRLRSPAAVDRWLADLPARPDDGYAAQ